MDWLAAMNRRFRFGPPKHKLPHTSGSLMRPISLPSGDQMVTPLYPTARPALLEHQTFPSTSQRIPSAEHLTPSIVKSAKRFGFPSFAPSTSNTNTSPLPPGPLSPGPFPVLTTYSFL